LNYNTESAHLVNNWTCPRFFIAPFLYPGFDSDTYYPIELSGAVGIGFEKINVKNQPVQWRLALAVDAPDAETDIKWFGFGDWRVVEGVVIIEILETNSFAEWLIKQGVEPEKVLSGTALAVREAGWGKGVADC
jgi:hypothetical protein